MAGVLGLGWTSDLQDPALKASYGPDGPWNALAVNVGNVFKSSGSSFSSSSSHEYVAMPMYPSWCSFSAVLTESAAEGRSTSNYSTARSSSVTSNVNVGGATPDLSDDPFDLSSFGIDLEFEGGTFEDLFSFYNDQNKAISSGGASNGAFVAIEDWSIDLLGPETEKRYHPEVGILSLGRSTWEDGTSQSGLPLPSIPELKENDGSTASSFWGFHMGSAVLEQAGSLVLGGYEQNRVLGDVGVFDNLDDADPNINQKMWLTDVALDVEVGSSPFKDGFTGSVYQGISELPNALSAVETHDGPRGSALTQLNPALPFIYLPTGTCEKVASYLPVKFDSSLGLYLWNTSDPPYKMVTKSPGYLSLSLTPSGSSSAKDLTIKVPFPLLDLTLKPPLSTSSVQYFPCKPHTTAPFPLGRAFLQAAFVGIFPQQNKTYLAQAPGPARVSAAAVSTQTVSSSSASTSLSALPSSSFLSSWSSHWTPLSAPSPVSSSSSSDEGALSAGAIAGIVLGSVAGVGLLASGICYLAFKRQKRNRRQEEERAVEEELWGRLRGRGRGTVRRVEREMERNKEKGDFGMGQTVRGGQMEKDRVGGDGGEAQRRVEEVPLFLDGGGGGIGGVAERVARPSWI